MLHLPALILCVWLWETCGAFSILSLYHMEDNHDVLDFLLHSDGKLFLAGAILFACTSVVVIWKYVALQKNGNRPLRFIVKWNILPLILIITLAEIALHVFSTDTSLGPPMLGRRALGPLRFEAAVHNLDATAEKVLLPDQLLGWTIRPNLINSAELYSSNIEGMRSYRPGNILDSSGATCRVALLGDSHTFGWDLKFEDTWGYHLEKDLQKECHVLNFGVPGYSVGQIYMRYLPRCSSVASECDDSRPVELFCKEDNGGVWLEHISEFHTLGAAAFPIKRP